VPVAAKFNLLTILQFLVSISGKIPQLMQLVNAIIALFADEIEAAVPPGGLEVVALSAEEETHVETITQALSAAGTQAVLDLAKLRQFAKWLNDISSSPLGKLLIGLFTGLAGG